MYFHQIKVSLNSSDNLYKRDKVSIPFAKLEKKLGLNSDKKVIATSVRNNCFDGIFLYFLNYGIFSNLHKLFLPVIHGGTGKEFTD